jgi:hypothetical protein
VFGTLLLLVGSFGYKPLEYLRSRDVRVLALAMAYSRVMRQGRPVEKREKRPAKGDGKQMTLKMEAK